MSLLITWWYIAADVTVDNIQETAATVQWVVPSVTEQQQYRVLYGTSAQLLDQTSSIVDGDSDISLTNQQYLINLTDLTVGTDYYLRVAATFGNVTIRTEMNEFRTLDECKCNFRKQNEKSNV